MLRRGRRRKYNRLVAAAITNFTHRLERGEAFVRAKSELVDTEGLSVHIKFTRARGRDVAGYYRWNDRRMVLAVKQRLRYPRRAAYGIGTTPRAPTSTARVPYRLVWHEEPFQSPDDLLVFVAGHEFWHFLCHSGQRKRDHETKANCHGFAWLREFRTWAGPGHPVTAIPMVPPSPIAQIEGSAGVRVAGSDAVATAARAAVVAAAAPPNRWPLPATTLPARPAAAPGGLAAARDDRAVVSKERAGRQTKTRRPVPVQLELF
ncbi:MAG TPA: hypothetical protein VEL28_07010 [Candidatus Binatia bacterium]|nr:hypothetical protein [Candidatus Binatia bacterium]